MTTLSKAEIEARKNSKPKREYINNTQALRDSGCSIMHIRSPYEDRGRKMTVAYQRINGSHLKIATAVCHPKDDFSRKMGTKTALANFASGKTVVVPMVKGYAPREIIGAMFEAVVF